MVTDQNTKTPTPNTDTNDEKTDLSHVLDEKIKEMEYSRIEDYAKDEAKKNGMPYVNLKGRIIDPRVLNIISEEDSRTGKIAPISKTEQIVETAVYNPNDQKTIEVLEKIRTAGYETKLAIVSMTSLSYAWKIYEANREKKIKDTEEVEVGNVKITTIKEKIKDFEQLKETILSMPITQVLDLLLGGAIQLNASDIHLEPEKKSIRLRYRIDGVLIDVMNFPPDDYPKLLSRIKLHAKIKINIHDAPQDGRFYINGEDKNVEVRVSILPGPEGESIVMRILDPSNIRKELKDLGMRKDTLETVQRLLQKTTGAILNTGPTGSGKTTTLYAFIQHINIPEIKIVTIEDPIEYRIHGIVQTQTSPEKGYSFANGLASIVRQDPDVILVGEIRDKETAEIAMQASLTGHLVFSTVHTNNAAGTIPRLVDLGVKATTLAPAINAAMAQRLVRRLCEHCKARRQVSKEDLEKMKLYLKDLPKEITEIDISENIEIYYPQKCDLCNNTGYRGRIGVYEILEIDADMERLIISAPAMADIEKMAMEKGMVTMLQDGLIKVAKGITSMEEVIRVVGI